MIKLSIDRTQLSSLVFVVAVAIAFVFRITTFLAFVTVGDRLILRVQAFALFAATCQVVSRGQYAYTTTVSRASHTILSFRHQ